MSRCAIKINVTPVPDTLYVKVEITNDDYTERHRLLPVEALKLARELSTAAAQLTAFAVENFE